MLQLRVKIKTAMLHLTAVASKEKDNDCNTFPETGVFKRHSPTKTCSESKYNNNNMFAYNCTGILLAMCLLSTCFVQQCLATLAASTNMEKKYFDIKAPPIPYECNNINIRRECEIFPEIKNCTVVTGFVTISLVYNNRHMDCNINDLRFDNLREITDFLFISDVENLTSIRDMFPNLTVIRGRRIFSNYAMLISRAMDLEKVEFKSLIALQRGHVIIEHCPKLCYTEKVNWARLTSKRGQNNIFLHEEAQCPKEVQCIGCKTDSCWSNDVCQKFETDSVISPKQDVRECHEECLGGCYNRTAQGCVVCKGYTDHGTCVKECPSDKYTCSRYMRCYTREECLNKEFYIHKNECVDYCPVDYELNNETLECDFCGGNNDCLKICSSDSSYYETIYLPDISKSELLKRCEIVNASIVIDIYEFFDPMELVENLKNIREIAGFLKINRSPFLTSLNFFKNLEKIHGLALEHNLYSLIIYNNKNLTDLWNVKPGFEMINGGMYIHANDKLCNRRIREFRQSIKHDNSLDSIQKSDQEVFCSPAKLNLYLQVLNQHKVILSWPRDQTLPEVEIIYRPVSIKEHVEEKSEIDTEVCHRINWRRNLKFAHEVLKNSTHYIHVIEDLEPHTRYAFLVKTFDGDDDTLEARSEVKYATTKFDVPKAPKIFVKDKTYDTLNIEFAPGEEEESMKPPIVDYYVLEVYKMSDDKNILDTRDYCDEPVMDFKDNSHEDYDECCSRREKESRDQTFLSKLKQEFACSMDHPEYCDRNDKDYKDVGKDKMYLIKRFEAWENKYAIRYLLRFHLYVLQLKACNHVGCSSYSMLSTRTNYSLTADKVSDFSVCKTNNTNEYKAFFSEPKVPNSYITSYALHFRNHISDDSLTTDHNGLVCITRLEHERNKYLYVAYFNYNFTQAALRVHSLGRHTFVDWVDITTCASSKLSGDILYYILGAFALFVFGICMCIWKKTRWGISLEWLRHCAPLHSGWRSIRPEEYVIEDRQTLVHGFEVVNFRNLPEEEMIELQERNYEE